MKDDDPIGIGDGTCRAQTDKAIMVVLEDDGRAIWIPQSCVHADSEVWEHGQSGRVVVLTWWAAKENLI